MIGVNLLRTKVLATTDEIIFHAPVDHQMDPRVLMQNILVAERRFIKPMLGATVYNDLINTKNILVNSSNKATLTTSVNANRPTDREAITLQNGDYVNSDTYLNSVQAALWSEHLHKIVAECVWFVSLPVNRSRFTAKGVVKNYPENIASTQESVTVDLKDLKHLMDRGLQDRISPLMDDMHQYLCDTAYPGYDKDCGCEDKKKKTDIIFGMYDDDDDEEDCKPCRSSSTTTTTVARKETIYFTDVEDLVINWTAARKAKFGDGAIFSFEILDEDGIYRQTVIEVVPDNIIDTTLYTADLGGVSSGRVHIT